MLVTADAKRYDADDMRHRRCPDQDNHTPRRIGRGGFMERLMVTFAVFLISLSAVSCGQKQTLATPMPPIAPKPSANAATGANAEISSERKKPTATEVPTQLSKQEAIEALKKRGAIIEDIFGDFAVLLMGKNATDADLVYLKALPETTHVDLSGNRRITDAGLENVKGLSKLRILYLRNTQVTDAGLKHLEGLTKLEELSVLFTKVTKKGAEQFEKTHPNVKVSQ
jgi:flagellar motor protein MotB